MSHLYFFILLVLLGSWPATGAAADFQPALPGRHFKFPADHAAHPDFKTEWWYYTGHLQSAEGEHFGYQLTFFRFGLTKPEKPARSAWSLHTLYFAHLGLTDLNRHTFIFREKAGRGALGLSGVARTRYHVWIDNWQAELTDQNHHLQAQDQEISLDLFLVPEKPPVIHGKEGISQKAAGTGFASHYYSLTRLATQGQLTYKGRTRPVHGQSWMDHEFSSSQLADYQVGWDWFSLQLQDGREIMLYLLRRRDGSPDPNSSGTLIDSQGRSQHLHLADFQVKPTSTWKSPHSGATYPSGWQVTIPAAGYTLELTPTVADQELQTHASTQIIYWEGSVSIQGKKNGLPVAGRGYVELTGYATSLGGKF
jgi:predicted secreted hydrolase